MGLTFRLGQVPLAIFTDSSNNVGIGGSPSGTYKLEVTGEGRFYQSATSTTAYLRVENNRTRNAAVYTATTNGGFYAGTSIGTDTFNYQIYDGVAGAARLTIASTGAATFSSTVTANASTSTGFIAQTTANSVYPYFRWVANNRSYWAGAIDTGTDATWQLGNGNTVGSSTILTINASNNAATFAGSVTAGGKIYTSASVADNIVEVINGDTTNGYGLYVRGGGTAANRYVARFKNGADNDVMWVGTSNVGIGTSDIVSTNLTGALTIKKSYNGDSTNGATTQAYYANQSALFLFGRNSGVSIISNNNEEGSIIFGNNSTNAYASIVTGSGGTSAGGDMYFRVGSNTERMRITSGGQVIAPYGYQSFKGSVSIGAGATTTIYTVPASQSGDGVYYVYCRLNGGSQIYMASAIVTALGSNGEIFISNTRTGSNVGLSVSGNNIRITNGGFGTFTWQWSILFQPVD